MRNPSQSSAPSSAAEGRRQGGPTPCCSKVGLKRGPWTPEEDEVLASFVRREGEGRWRTLPKRAGLRRCGKSCRLRWMNYLRPSIKRGPIAPDEEDLILRLHRLLGNRWSLIAGRIPGRTDNEIKNYWNTHLSKKLISQGIDPRTHKPLASSIINPPDAIQQQALPHLSSYTNPNPNSTFPSVLRRAGTCRRRGGITVQDNEKSFSDLLQHDDDDDDGYDAGGWQNDEFADGAIANQEGDDYVEDGEMGIGYYYNNIFSFDFVDSLINEDAFQQQQNANDNDNNNIDENINYNNSSSNGSDDKNDQGMQPADASTTPSIPVFGVQGSFWEVPAQIGMEEDVHEQCAAKRTVVVHHISTKLLEDLVCLPLLK